MLTPSGTTDTSDIGLPHLRAEQTKDPEIRALRDAFVNKTYTPRQARKYQLIDGSVFTNTDPPQAYIPKHLRPAILAASHDSALAGHFASSKMRPRLNQFYWPKLPSDVRKYARSCLRCQRYKNNSTREGSLTPIRATHVAHIVTADIKYCPRSSDGYQYFLLLVQNFTRFVWARPLKTLTAREAIEVFKQYILEFGAFRVLHVDLGSGFISAQFTDFLKSFGTRIEYASVGEHSLTGLAEVCIRDVANTLALLCNENLPSWPKLLPASLFAVNTSVRSKFNCSSFELLYGYTPLTPSTILYALPKEVTPTQKLIEHFELRTRSLAAHDRFQQQLKRDFDSRHMQRVYRIGQKVLVFRKSTMRAAKFRFAWHGPFKVQSQSGPSSYIVRVLHHG
jgi:transposase InsO family protein